MRRAALARATAADPAVPRSSDATWSRAWWASTREFARTRHGDRRPRHGEWRGRPAVRWLDARARRVGQGHGCRHAVDGGTASPRMTIFDPFPVLTVTIEDADGRAEVHLHAGGQGLWIGRMAAALGARVRLVCANRRGVRGRPDPPDPGRGHRDDRGDHDRRLGRLRARPTLGWPGGAGRGRAAGPVPSRARRALRAGARRGARHRCVRARRPAGRADHPCGHRTGDSPPTSPRSNRTSSWTSPVRR